MTRKGQRNAMPEGCSKVRIAHITKDYALQVRARLSEAQIKRYAEVMRNGNPMPPIKLAQVGDMLLLIDGWHRLAAMELLEWPEAEAEIVEATKKEAMWLAASANLQHGVPLKASEIRQVFKAYVKAGQHRKSDGELKSYREIAKELSKPHTTIRNWMIRFFPSVASKMGDCDDDFVGDGGLRQKERESEATQHLRGLREVFASSTDEDFRGSLIESLEVALEDMKASGGWSRPEF